MRRSIASKRNSKLGNWSKWGKGRSNLTYFAEALRTMRGYGVSNGAFVIGLVGSRDLPGICLRRAQSVLRDDLRPSYWSHAFVITANWDGDSPIGSLPIAEVPFFARNGEFPEPARNAVVSTTLGHYGNKTRDANVALFAVSEAVDGEAKPLGGETLATLNQVLATPNLDRDRFDFWRELALWKQYFWSGEQLPNPSLAGNPIPATSFIEMLFEQIGVDLTPSASDLNSAPEHLWTSTLWWLQEEVQRHRGVEGTLVSGCFVIRDSGAASLAPDEAAKK